MALSVFPLYYFPPISWFALAMHTEDYYLEAWQHYRKQQYTTRTYIKAATGVVALTLPVGRKGMQVPLMEKRLSFQTAWPQQHFRSLYYAYKNSPYFDYYADTLERLLKPESDHLVTFLQGVIEEIWKLLGVEKDTKLTEAYVEGDQYLKDWREAFDPNRRTVPDGFKSRPYIQVFDGFEPNLSILDLLCNEGPQSRILLQNSYIPLEQ